MTAPGCVMAYVHDAPDHSSIETRWRDPALLADFGFTDVVVADQMSGCLGLVMADADLSEVEKKADEARQSGLKPWVMDDLLTLPKGFEGDVVEESVRLVGLLFERLPEVEGLVLRLGETFTSPRPWVERRDVFSTDVGSILAALLDEVCRKRGKQLLIRLWTLEENSLHDSPALWRELRAQLGEWPSNARVSVKYTRTDYWMYNDWNPHIASLDVPFLIEFQAEREYEGIGLMPAYPAAELIDGMEGMENPNWAGYYLIPKGGGWSAPHAEDDRWPELNLRAILEGEEEACNVMGISREEARAVTELTRKLFYSAAWFERFQRQWMPLENWFRDDTFVPGACARIASTLAEDEALKVSFLAERSVIVKKIPDEERFMRAFAAFSEQMWATLVEAAPLDRDAAKRLIRAQLEDQPLGPIRVLD